LKTLGFFAKVTYKDEREGPFTWLPINMPLWAFVLVARGAAKDAAVQIYLIANTAAHATAHTKKPVRRLRD